MDNPYQQIPDAANRRAPSSTVPEPAQWAPSMESTQPDLTGPPWVPSPGFYGHQMYGFSFAAPGGGGLGGPHLGPPYGFDPSIPPPPFGRPPPGPFPGTVPSGPVHGYPSSTGTFQTGHLKQQQQQQVFRDSGAPHGGPLLPPPLHDYDRGPVTTTRPEDEAGLQRRQDIQWLRQFVQNRVKKSTSPQTQRPDPVSTPALKEALYAAVRLVSALEESCQTLKQNLENDCVWTDSYLTALNTKRELQDKLKVVGDRERLNQLKAKLARVSKRRARRLRANQAMLMEENRRQEHIREKEAAIDGWRMKQIHDVEEKKKEQELKLAADSVLCEVRKKQADVKRMQDILRSLEKLRRLRKEAASRKGIVTEQEYDDAFSIRLEQLRTVMKRRTAVYAAEQKALMVMLEGEQEEERRKEQERRMKRERERQLQRKQRVDSILFGDEHPTDSLMQPFREYYTQAQHSLDALIQIRREWDVFVVAPDHPDGSSVPQGWILPDHPSDQDWASSLQTADTDEEKL
ncbi:programmed cell death protein 7 [Mastacembelus armatus]|uniref:Programmed cell death 7 n=1 Tax=Mastacembelus armatus TaxID=205130 RepID=A0A3Q3KUU2_9TELE|nr:programmed cell death protein 7 [Mastacembelus armatus]